MTVANMTAHQLFGLMVLALAVFWLWNLTLREYRNISLPLWRQKILFGFGCLMLFGVPVLIGLRALL